MLKVKLSKCPCCGENYGEVREGNGVGYIHCKCDTWTNGGKLLAVFVGIAFCFLILVQVEKNMHILKKVVDLVCNLW
jgi:hypothetical protein